MSVVILLLPFGVFAAEDSLVPEFNPICWKATDCTNARLQFLRKTYDEMTPQERDDVQKNGFVTGEDPCRGKASDGQEWGKCLPGGLSITKISFGGQNRFSNVGTFIQAMYKYSIVIVGVLAATMVVIAGFQWIMSGGNSEVISEAQHRIMNAIVGALIAYGAFFILNTINPDLVQLKIPAVFMIRPQSSVAQFCSAAPVKSTKYALASLQANQSEIVETPTHTVQYSLTYDDSFKCGNRYFVQDGGKQLCLGDVCDPGQLCVNFGNSDPKNPYHCDQGLVAGNIVGTAGGVSDIQIDNNLELIALCTDGAQKKISTIDVNNQSVPHAYIFKDSKSQLDACGGKEKTAGFFFIAEVNDETGGTGHILEGIDAQLLGFIPTSWGEDDGHLVGESGPGSRDCSVNLATLGNRITQQFPLCELAPSYAACAADFLVYSSHDNMKILANNPDFTRHLITYDELQRGFQCDLNIDRGEFRAMSSEPSGFNPNPNGINGGNNSFINK